MTRGRLLFSLLGFLPVLVYCNQSESTSADSENVARVLSLLRSGEEKLNLGESRDVILVLGNAGSGKSTFTQFLAGNKDELFGEEVGEGENRSGNSTRLSKTLIPEKVVSYGSQIVLYDCPGFGEIGQNEVDDIAAAYFIKRVLENVKNIKIVLTVSYSSLRKGANRQDFFELLEHVGVLIKNVEEYVKGVALIATKVKLQGVLEPVPDNRLIEDIGQFLVEVEQSLKTKNYTSKSKHVKDEVFQKNGERLLNALLEKNGAQYSRLGLFKGADAPGRISDSKSLQNERKAILNVLHNHLEYVPVDVADIGYAVSEKSKIVVSELETQIFDMVTSDMARLNLLIVDRFKTLEREMLDDDVQSLTEQLNEASKALARISSINESVNVGELVSHIRQNLPELCRSTSKPILDDMARLGEFYNFLQRIDNKKIKPMTKNWIVELQPAINYVENALQWYDFLEALHRRLSEYDIQSNTKRILIPELGSESRSLGSIANFADFFNQICDLDLLKVVNLKELQKINVDAVKVKYFELVVSSSLRTSCDFAIQRGPVPVDGVYPNVATASGEYVKLSDVVNHLNLGLARSLLLFAKHTVFIDTDLTESIDVWIISPRWVVVDYVTIILNGLDGPGHNNSQAPDVEEWSVNRNGHDGKPGNPGESGNHFFGIGEVFKNMEKLTIRARGGDGGSGQNGGDGARGWAGFSPKLAHFSDSLKCDLGEKCEANAYFYVGEGVCSWYMTGYLEYMKFGSAGGRGGDAGRGGAGGMGGYAGSITVLGMGVTKPSYRYQIGLGEEGEYGLHGKCGMGGIGGTNYISSIEFGETKQPKYNYSEFGAARDGRRGTCLYSSSKYSSNFENRPNPVPKTPLFPPSLVVSRFRNELIANLKNSLTKRHAFEFYQTLQKKEIIQYDSAELIHQELVNTLEAYYNQLDPRVNRLLYDLLLQRIREQFKAVQNDTESESRTLLEYLSAMVHSQFVRMNNSLESQQILISKAYFDVMKSEGYEFGNFFASKATSEIELIAYFVWIIKRDTFDIIERTANEIIEISNNNTTYQLGDKLVKLKILDSLKTVIDFLKLCGTLATADLALANNLKVTSVLPVRTTTYADGNYILDDLNIMEESFEKYVEAVRSCVLKEKTTLKTLGIKYDEVCDQLQTADEYMLPLKSPLASKWDKCVTCLDLSDIGQCESTCHQLPHAYGDLLARKSPLSSKLYDYQAYFATSDMVGRILNLNAQLLNDSNIVAQNAASKFVKDVKLLQFSTKLHERFLIHGVNPSGVISFIENLQKYTTFVDRADYVDKSILQLSHIMDSVRHVARNSLIWNKIYEPDDQKEVRKLVTEALSNVKLQLSKLATQFEIDEDLQLLIENINEAVDTMVSIYNGVLPSQQDRALLKSFYKYFKDQGVLKNDNKHAYLVEMINDNLLFYEYERLLDMFKKYTSLLNATFTVTPSAPNINANHTINRQRIKSNVAILESNLKSLHKHVNASILGIDKQFNNVTKQKILFQWKSPTFKKSILKLLRGGVVALKATPTDKNLQFLRIHNIKLVFKSDDLRVQQSLDKEISKFKVVMTHLGRSYVDLCGHTRLINQDAVTFVNKANEAGANAIKDHNTDPILFLSPYTTWIFRLIPANESVSSDSLLLYRKSAYDSWVQYLLYRKSPFDSLLPYRKSEGISIQLEGTVTYIDSKNDIFCQNMLRDGDAHVLSGNTTEPSELVQKRPKSEYVESSSGTFGEHSFPGFEHSTVASTTKVEEALSPWSTSYDDYD